MKEAIGKTNTHNGKYIHNGSLVCDSQEKSKKEKDNLYVQNKRS